MSEEVKVADMKPHRKRKSLLAKSTSEKITHWVMFGVLSVLCSSYLFLMLWGFVMGCMTHNEVITAPFEWPSALNLKNYIDAWQLLVVNDTNMFGMIVNSLWLTVGGAFLDVFFSLTMAYACAKFRFFGRNIIHGASIVIMMLPIIGSGGAAYRLVYNLGIDNSPLYLIKYCAGFGSQYIILYGFMQNLSWSYAEAAYLDGASEAQVFFKVMIPMCISPVVALFVLQAIGVWNDYNTSLLYLKEMPTLATGLYLFDKEMLYRVRMDILMAACMLSVLPILILFLVFNKTLLDLDLGGGLKG